jgi:hypothetical protein
MFDDISFLVQETLNDAEKQSPSSKGFLSNFFSREVETPDEVPGFFYHLQKKSSTFVIRIHPSANLKTDFKNINKHPDLYPTLRLQEGEGELSEKLSYFECDRFEVATNIKSHLGNKRFPMFEERIFNVSDPGDSWWLKCDENKMTLLFKLSHTEDIGSLIKLGPLGDAKKSLEIFKQLFGYFKMIFPVEDYSSGYGQVCMTCAEDQHLHFENLKLLFQTGETSHEFWEYLRQLEMNSQDKPVLESLQKANYFLMELGFTRSFWKTIEEQL